MEIALVDADTMAAQTKRSTFRGNEASQRTSCAVFSAHGHYVLIGNSYDSRAQIWDSTSRKLIDILDGHFDGIASVAFAPNEQQVFVGSYDRKAGIWDCKKRALLTTWACDYVVTSAAFSPDGTWVLTNSGEQAIIWDCKCGERLAALDEHTRDVRCMAFSPDGRSVLTGAADKTAYIWDSITGKTIKALEGHTASVISAVFSPDGLQALTSSDDKTIRLWDSKNGQLRNTFTVDIVVHMLAFSPDGSIIAACDRHGHMMLLKGDNPKRGNLLGLYIAPHELRAMHWLDSEHVMLVDTGATCDRPHFYRLKLEGMFTIK
jgi:WD40 repeat protein